MSDTATTESTKNTAVNRNNKANGATVNTGKEKDAKANQQRVISNPNDVAQLVLMQLDAVNAKKDDLTIAIKGLMDTSRQLVRAYAGHAYTIEGMKKKIQELEEKLSAKDK